MSDNLIIWEAPVIVKPECRLYYDETGRVICYTCEKLEGNFIVIDTAVFAQGRPDVRVIDGKISTVQPGAIVSKLIVSLAGGISCLTEDISIVVTDESVDCVAKWKLKTYEL